MRPAELYAFLALGAVLALGWLGWLAWRLVPLWLPVGLTALAVLLLMARMVLIAVRQD